MKLILVIVIVLALLSSTGVGQNEHIKAVRIDSVTTMLVFSSDQLDTPPFNLAHYDSAFSLRNSEFDSLTAHYSKYILTLQDENLEQIDSVLIQHIAPQLLYSLVLRHSTLVSQLVGTHSAGVRKTVKQHTFGPLAKKIGYVYEDNKIRAVNSFNGNSHEGFQFYFSNNTLDSAFEMWRGKKMGFEYIFRDSTETVLEHLEEGTVRLDLTKFSDKNRFTHSSSYYTIYPTLKHYKIQISGESILNVFVQREQMELLLENDFKKIDP
jgi:hypothetical protein